MYPIIGLWLTLTKLQAMHRLERLRFLVNQDEKQFILIL
jgi:hypothetical protein